MRKLISPQWIWVINTLPIAILFVVFHSQFNIIKTLLDEDNIQLWKYFGWTLGVLGVLNCTYAVWLVFKKQNVSMAYGLIALLCYIPFIYLYIEHAGQIIPFFIPRWMILDNLLLYVVTFLMPTLFHSILVLVVHFTSETKEHRAWINFSIAISVPVSGYLFAQVLLPFLHRSCRGWNEIEHKIFNQHVILTLVIVATLVFLFFLLRAVFILAAKKSAVLKKHQWLWKISIALVLPLLGLLINNGHLLNEFYVPFPMFDFGSLWFYALAVLNGVFICLPNTGNPIYRLFLFFGRSITFSYTFYFFLVFLPFLPLSLVAIVFFGLGFLVLTPLLLFVIHTHELYGDFSFLKSCFPKKRVIGAFLLGFLVIPASITANYLKDKNVLNKALEYVYHPNYSKEYRIDKNSLQKTLQVLNQHKTSSRNFPFSNQIPYLSSYFNWLVLDNLTLPDAKISMIEKIFFGEASSKAELNNIRSENARNEPISISNISTSSAYDRAQNAWKSWVDLEITNTSENSFSEYSTTFELPEGAWISDYYLYVGEQKEPGILAEKKSAMWVFSNIRNENRDPGILYYLTGNRIAFRVFPFSQDETRKTGIEFLHKEPIQLRIDNHIVELGNAAETIYENVENENVLYVSSKQKQTLKSVYRKPYFHFLVDASKDKDKHSHAFAKRIEQFLKNNAAFSENAQVSFVNSHVRSFPFGDGLEKHPTFEGGFYLDRGVKTVLSKAFQDNSRPVIVVVSDNIQNAIWDKDFADFKLAFPESNLFFNLGEDLQLQAHSLMHNPKEQLPYKPECLFCETVLEYRLADNSVAYLPDNGEPSVVLKRASFEIAEQEIKEKNWQSALSMQAKWSSQVLHPENSDREWLNFVKHSFISKTMTPATSFLVVENEAQKAILKKKQEQILSSKGTLDFDSDPQQMSEPNLWLLAMLLGVALCHAKRNKGKRLGRL
jgi:hypothetical protein